MKTFIKSALLTSVIISIILTGCNSSSVQTSKEIIQKEEKIKNLKSEVELLKVELKNKKYKIQTMLNEKNDQSEYFFSMGELYHITVNGKEIKSESIIVDEYGLRLDAICNVWADMNIKIQEYTDKTFGGFKGVAIPKKLKVSYREKSVEFEGVAYASPLNGEPRVQYIAGRFGEVSARYIKGFRFETKTSFSNLCELLGIGCIIDNYTINLYTDDNDDIVFRSGTKMLSMDYSKNVKVLYECNNKLKDYHKVFNYERDKIILLECIDNNKYEASVINTKNFSSIR